MHIRKGTRADMSQISKTIRASYRTVARKFNLTPDNCPKHPSNCTDEWISRDFDRGVEYFLLESKETVIGCVALEKVDSELCYLERLAVLPENRHRGVGRMLVDHVFEEAKSKGCQRIGIGIISKQLELKQWYKGIGFIEGETKTFEHLPFQVSFMEYPLT